MRAYRTWFLVAPLLVGCAATAGQGRARAPATPISDVPETKHHVPLIGVDSTPARDAAAGRRSAQLLAVTEKILARADRVGVDRLTTEERNVAAVWGLEADLSNGGFDQYFFNASADLASVVPDALRDMGAVEAAAIVEQAVGAFGEEGPATEQSERQWQLAVLGTSAQRQWAALDRKFSACADDIPGLLEAYVAENADRLL